jgi:hypothetical protein
MGAELLSPPRVDRGRLAAPQPGGLDQLAGHDVVGLRAEERGAGGDGEARAAGAEIVAAGLVPEPDVAEQAGEDALVDRVDIRLAVVAAAGRVHPGAAARGAQLGDEVLPLPDAQVVEVLGLAHPPEGAGGQRLLLLADVGP